MSKSVSFARKTKKGIKFGFYVNDNGVIKEEKDVRKVAKIIKDEKINNFENGLKETMDGRAEFQRTENGLKMTVPKENVKNIIGLSTSETSAYEQGKFYADSYFRTNDLDPQERDTFYEEDERTGKRQAFSRSRLIQWIETKKVFTDQAEFSKLAGLPYLERQKELERISYRVARKIFGDSK